VSRLLEARGLRKSFGGVWALHDLDLHQDDDETLGMIGPNGSGKTTCINAITGHLSLDGGEVRFGAARISGRAPHRIAQEGLVRTYQAVRVYGRFTVEENMRIASLPHWHRLGRRDPLEGVDALLARVGLADRGTAPAGALTLFEQRRLELAMRLVCGPKLLMLDEPVAGLHPTEIRAMMQLLQELRRDCALFVIEHTMKVITELANRVVVLVSGEKIADGPPAAILRDENVIRQYLGSVRARDH
jgi:ABC-type branched-subunit amino acid transport system ATPase component